MQTFAAGFDGKCVDSAVASLVPKLCSQLLMQLEGATSQGPHFGSIAPVEGKETPRLAYNTSCLENLDVLLSNSIDRSQLVDCRDTTGTN